MPDEPLGLARLTAQGLTARPFDDPAQVAAHLGAMQGQDLGGVISSIVLRLSSGRVADVVAAMDDGSIVRGYPMRGTVFIVPAADLAWLTQLCAAPAVRAAERRRGQLGLDAHGIGLAAEAAARVLGDQKRGLSRSEVFAVWQTGGQPTDAGRGYHILTHLISTGLLCYGPWNGTDQNVVLADRWLPRRRGLEQVFNGERVAAVAEFLRTYLTSHGPASLADFAWWTKLPVREIKAAHGLIVRDLERAPDASDGQERWQRIGLADEVRRDRAHVRNVLLLPGFDEFILGYQDRLFAMEHHEHVRLVPGNNGVFQRSVVIGGRVRALWRLGGRPGKRTITLEEFGDGLTATERERAQRAFAAFPLVSG